MTTTDARKRNRDMADAHETARARDARGTDFHREWLHVMDTQHPHTPQENDMPNNQRRHREQMGVLDQIHDTLAEIRDRLPEREVACGDVWRDETERPCTRPSGHDGNHVDKVGTIWANPEPADITEEPPVGSQVTDTQEDVWSRTADGWGCWEGGVRIQTITGDAWGNVRNHAPLRPTTDADRVRVGLPVESAPADVDPDEALAKVLFDFNGRGRHDDQWSDAGEGNREFWLDVARAAREHIEAERAKPTRIDKMLGIDPSRLESQLADRAVKAEADLARVTEERDTAERLANRNADTARDFEDRYETSHANFLAASSDLDKAQAKADRYDALREDGALAKAILHSLDFPPSSLLGEAVTAAVTDVLTATDRDDERAES